MISLRLVSLLLLCALPLPGLAQVSPQGGALQAPTTPPPLVPAPSEPEAPSYDSQEPPEESAQGELIPRAPRAARPAGGRMVLEFLGGALLGTTGVIPGSYLTLDALFCECSGLESEVALGLGLAFIGLSGGAALGVMGGGILMGGDGRFLPTLVGGVLGTLGGLTTAILVASFAGAAALIPLLVGPVVGAMIGFELSLPTALEGTAELTPSSHPRVMPLVTVTRGGGILGGLVGRF